MRVHHRFAALPLAIPLLACGAILWAADSARAAEPTPIEHVTAAPVQNGGGLGTIKYKPSAAEKPFYEKLDAKEKSTGSLTEGYKLATPGRKFVGWFGIVREIKEDKDKGQTTLTVEHKYFDGLTDAHIQAVSFNGGGDFEAVLPGVNLKIPLLSLIKVYGVPAEVKKGERPRVDAQFVRDWHWKTFTFINAYGKQSGSEKWRKLNKVKLDDIYKPYPDTNYYEQRLGPQPKDDSLMQRLLEPAGPLNPEDRKALLALFEPDNGATMLRTIKTIEQRDLQRPAVAILLVAIREEKLESWLLCFPLGRLAGAEDVPAIVAMLDDINPPVRLRAAEVLRRMGKSAKSATPALIKVLRDPSPQMRSNAIRALSNSGPAAMAAVEPLKTFLRDPNWLVRSQAAEALWNITFQPEPSLEVLISALHDDDENVKGFAAQILEAFGPAAVEAGPALVAALSGKDNALRATAAQALGEIRPATESTLPALIKRLQDEDPFTRTLAAEALGKYCGAAAPAVPALVSALEDEDSEVRSQAVTALGNIGLADSQAVASITRLLTSDKDRIVRISCADALGKLGLNQPASIDALAGALLDNDYQVRLSAVLSLGKLGSSAKIAAPAMRRAFQDEDWNVRVAAAGALWQVTGDTDASMPVILESLKTGVPNLAADAAGKLGAQAKIAVPLLISLLETEEKGMKFHSNVIVALGDIGPDAAPAVAALEKALQSRTGHDPLGATAALALWKIDRSPQAIPALIEMLGEEDCRDSSIEAIASIGPKAEAALPALKKLFQEPDPKLHKAVGKAIMAVKGTVQDPTAE